MENDWSIQGGFLMYKGEGLMYKGEGLMYKGRMLDVYRENVLCIKGGSLRREGKGGSLQREGLMELMAC